MNYSLLSSSLLVLLAMSYADRSWSQTATGPVGRAGQQAHSHANVPTKLPFHTAATGWTVSGLGITSLLGSLRFMGQHPTDEPSVAVRAGEHRLPFHARNGFIYIPARVNGNHATLLLDTGAVLTTFSLKIVPAINTDSRITINMAKGSMSAFRVPVGFTLGDSDLKELHCSFRQSVVVGDFKFEEADGVIGLDVLSSFRVVTIDFQNSVLILEDR